MVSFYTGTPGSGKSYHLAQLVYDKLKYQDINVIANFEVNLDNIRLTYRGYLKSRITEMTNGKIKFKKYNSRPLKGRFYYWDNSQITVDNLLAFAAENHVRRTRSVDVPQTLVLIDEAGIVFNCRGFGDRNRQKWVNFFAKHRHYNFDIVLCCQFDRQVDKQIRCCVEYEQIHRKLKNFQFLGWLASTLAGGNLFVICENWYMNHLKCGNHLLRYRHRIAALYDTLRDFDSSLGTSANTPPPGVGGVRGPTAQTPDAVPEQSDIENAAAATSAANNDKIKKWKMLLKGEKA